MGEMTTRCPDCGCFLRRPELELDDVLRRAVHIYACRRCGWRLLRLATV